MSFICPACGEENYGATLRCPCGYESISFESRKRKVKKPLRTRLTVMLLLTLALIGIMSAVTPSGKYNTLINRAFNLSCGISLAIAAIALSKTNKVAYSAFKVAVTILVIQSMYLLIIIEKKFMQPIVLATLVALAISYLIGRFIARNVSPKDQA